MSIAQNKQLPEYYKWHGYELDDFFAEVQRRGVNNVIIEFHPDYDAHENSLLYIRDEVQDAPQAETAESHNGNGGYNNAHPCPLDPDCP